MDTNLTWRDIKQIVNIADEMIDDDIKGFLAKEMTEQEYYQEILNRYRRKTRKNNADLPPLEYMSEHPLSNDDAERQCKYLKDLIDNHV